MTLRVLKRFVVVCALGLASAGPALADGSGVVPAAPVPQENPNRETVRIDQRLGYQLPLDVVLRDESERPITLREAMNGKVTILVPVYFRCPMLCTNVLNGLLDALRGFPQDFTAGDQFTVLTLSMDPKEHADLGAPKKKAYLGEYGRLDPNDPYEPGWRFLTGNKESVAELLGAVGFHYEFDKAFKEYNHPSAIIILTPEGKVSRYFMGVGYDDESVRPLGEKGATGVADSNPPPPSWRTLKLSLVEASGGKIGSLADNLLLICYRFDHLSQGYAVNILRVVQLAGVLTLLAVGTWIGLSLRRERRALAAGAGVTPNGTQKNGQPGVTE